MDAVLLVADHNHPHVLLLQVRAATDWSSTHTAAVLYAEALSMLLPSQDIRVSQAAGSWQRSLTQQQPVASHPHQGRLQQFVAQQPS